MDQSIKETLIEWLEIAEKVKENTSLLLKDSTLYSNECAARMKLLEQAESTLISLAPVASSISALDNWIKARLDIGCDSCWLTSSKDMRHNSCAAKIELYFSTQEMLIKFVKTLEV